MGLQLIHVCSEMSLNLELCIVLSQVRVSAQLCEVQVECVAGGAGHPDQEEGQGHEAEQGQQCGDI